MRTAPAIVLITAFAALSSIGDTFAAGNIVAVPPAEYRPTAVVPKAAAALVAPDAPVFRLALPAPSDAERESLKAQNAKRAEQRRVGRPTSIKSRPLAIGYPRELPSASRSIVLSDLAWKALPDGGRATRIEIASPGAAALRLSLSMPAAHPDLSLRFVGNSPRADVQGAYPVNAVAEASALHGAYWSPVLEGDTATIEVHAGAGASFDGLVLALGPLSHLVIAGDDLRQIDAKRAADIGDSGSCNIDLACTNPSSALTQAGDAVGKLLFNDRSGSTFLCSGTMLNDSVTSFTPYLFTAAHCIEDAFNAGTVNVYWFFRALSCGSTSVPPYALQTGGSMLLARSVDYDWTMLRLYTSPPAGVRYSAWRAEPVPTNAIGTALHHPGGDLLKWSQGSMFGYYTFSDGSSFMQMRWSDGTTETGSSGSGLFTFLQSGGYYELRGGLFGGDASCSNRTGVDYYSRLDNMLPVTRQYLTPDAANPTGQTVVVEYYNRSLDHFFMTADANEINLLDTGQLRGWERTGVRFLAYTSQRPGTNPVCRFYLSPPRPDTHFYSGKPSECEDVRRRFPDWTYEGPSVFYIYLPNEFTSACPAGTRPIWRFFNTRVTNHRYTPEVTIRDELRNTPGWTAEGDGPDEVVMCSPTTN
jgi:hypothetical protein